MAICSWGFCAPGGLRSALGFPLTFLEASGERAGKREGCR